MEASRRLTADPVSIRIYHDEIKGQKSDDQKSMVMAVLKTLNRPCTSKEILLFLQSTNEEIDIVSCRRAVSDLKKEGRIESAFVDECKLSKKPRNVHYWQPIRSFIGPNGQVNLF